MDSIKKDDMNGMIEIDFSSDGDVEETYASEEKNQEIDEIFNPINEDSKDEFKLDLNSIGRLDDSILQKSGDIILGKKKPGRKPGSIGISKSKMQKAQEKNADAGEDGKKRAVYIHDIEKEFEYDGGHLDSISRKYAHVNLEDDDEAIVRQIRSTTDPDEIIRLSKNLEQLRQRDLRGVRFDAAMEDLQKELSGFTITITKQTDQYGRLQSAKAHVAKRLRYKPWGQ